jgi:urocanate hydratase
MTGVSIAWNTYSRILKILTVLMRDGDALVVLSCKASKEALSPSGESPPKVVILNH